MISNFLNLFFVLSYCSACWFGVNGKSNQKRSQAEWFQERLRHKGLGISDVGLQKIADLGNEKHFNETLTKILIPRVVDTPNHATVRKFIVNQMENLGWNVETHSFTEQTPIGGKTFTNVIATLNPAATRRLVLACHYDSKLTPKNFLGATDSAVPCSMLINLAFTMMKEFDIHKRTNPDLTLQLYFIDGEEAFEKWSSTDSLYGSRKLAEKLQKTPYPPGGRSKTNELHRIDLFVLLDLIGTEDIQFFSLFQESDKWYLRLSSFEKRLLDLNLLPRRKAIFREQAYYHASIEDDHIPFLRKGVPILHLISVPFPDVWHKITDNRNALHPPSIENMNSIIRAFVADYLHLLL